MKKLLFAALLLCSTFANALPVDQWNKRFSELNNVPLNAKWNAYGQQAYLRQLLSSRPSYFKNPDDYSQLVAPAPVVVHPPSVAPTTVTSHTSSLQDALKAAQATVKAIEDLIARGI